MALSHAALKFLRTLHLYLGAFAAPTLLFLAVTGGLQVFSLHETTRGSSYVPPSWLVSASRLHKKQTLTIPARRPAKPSPSSGKDIAVSGEATAGTSTVVMQKPKVSDTGAPRWPLPQFAMKVFFALISVSLLLSIISGLLMAYRFSRRPRLLTGVLAAGVAILVLLLLV